MECGHIVFECHVEQGSPCQFCDNCHQNKACNDFSGEWEGGEGGVGCFLVQAIGVNKVCSSIAELHLVHMFSNLGSTLLCNTSDDELFYIFLCLHLVFNNSSLSKMHFPNRCIL